MQTAIQKETNLRNLNLLFLIVLVLQVSNLLFLWMPHYLRLVLNEALFVFLPAYLYLRFTRQPIRPRVRWNWPGGRAALLSLLIGAGLYPASAAAAGLLQSVLGYVNLPVPPDVLPTTFPAALLAVLAYAIMAPLCEEFLFRGLLQPAYERHGPRWGVLFVGLLFIIFHLSLLQGLSIILLALALGFINYRTRSLPASILAHFGANSLAALVITQAVFNLDITTYLFSLPAILTGLLLAFASLFTLSRTVLPVPGTAQTPQVFYTEAAPARIPLTAAWPLLLSGITYLALAGAEVYSARSQLHADPLTVQAVHQDGTRSWHYQLTNYLDEPVGEGECQLSVLDEHVEILCSSYVAAYDITIDRSTWMSDGGTRVDQARWGSSDARLISGWTRWDLLEGDFQLQVDWMVADEGMQVRRAGNIEDGSFMVPYSETPLAKDPYLLLVPDHTWPWQLSGIGLQPGEAGAVVRFNPYTWREATRDMGMLWEPRLVSVAGLEQVTTPAGAFTAWKVDFGPNQSAWYSLDDQVVVMFFNGAETWALK